MGKSHCSPFIGHGCCSSADSSPHENQIDKGIKLVECSLYNHSTWGFHGLMVRLNLDEELNAQYQGVAARVFYEHLGQDFPHPDMVRTDLIKA